LSARLDDPGFTAQQHADALHVERRGVLDRARGEFVVDAERRQVHEVHRDQRSLEERQIHLGGDREHRLRGVVVAGEDDTGDGPLGHLLEDHRLVQLAARLQIGHLGCTNDLYPLVGKILEETREGQRGAIDASLADQPVEAGVTRHELQFELFPVGVVEVGDSDAVDSLLHTPIPAQ
jgi:hypothetical protein